MLRANIKTVPATFIVIFHEVVHSKTQFAAEAQYRTAIFESATINLFTLDEDLIFKNI